MELYNLAEIGAEMAERTKRVALGAGIVLGTGFAEDYAPPPSSGSAAAVSLPVISGEKITQTTLGGSLVFTQKELSGMPSKFRKMFRLEGCVVHVSRRMDGPHRGTVELRYRRNGYNITVSARSEEEAKQKFIQKLHEIEKAGTEPAPKVPTGFVEFALFWFENHHRRKVTENSYKKNLSRFNSTVRRQFGGLSLKQINVKMVQDLLDQYSAKGMGKTVDEVHSLLNQIFKFAVRYGLIASNPVELVVHKKHEPEHGSALTLEEEKLLLSASAGTPYQLMFAIALYTGLRPCEFKYVEIGERMITTVNAKRKGGKIEYKRIPIIAALRPYLEGVKTVRWVTIQHIRDKFNSILPGHILYDLRTNFYTHCVQCGVSEAAINAMVGHSGGVLKRTYTDLSDEYLLAEAEKLVW